MLSLQWTKHLSSKEERDDFERALRTSIVFDRFMELMKEEEQLFDKQETSLDDFSDPNWSHKQAFRNGQRAFLKRIKQLFPEG